MKDIKGTLVILTRNEIKGLNEIFDKIPMDRISEVICIDGKSTDGSINFLEKRGVKIITQEKMGRGEAFRIACKHAKYKNMVFFSPDGNESPNDIIRIFIGLEKGYDMVIASRFMKHSKADDSDELIPIRSFGNRMFTAIINKLWGGKLYDSINGFRGIKKSKFNLINPDADGFGIEFQMSIRALKLGFKIKEFPTIEGDRIGGKSTAYTLSTGSYFIKLIIKELFLRKKFLNKGKKVK